MTKSLTVNGDTFEMMISERKIKNRTKPNSQLFAEYCAVIGNSYSPAYLKEAARLMGQYQAFLGEAPPSGENFSSFFLRYRSLKPNSRARYHNAFSAFFISSLVKLG